MSSSKNGYFNVENIPTKRSAKLFAAGFVAEQLSFHLYHHNSYANNPAMLRSPKPLIMRDVFLTKASSPVPNPLSSLYVPHRNDMLWNICMAWGLGVSAVSHYGASHMLICYALGGMVSGFAWLFQAQISPNKLNTQYDCNATSTGAWCSLCAINYVTPHLRLPLSRRMPLLVVTVPFGLRAIYVEYIDPFTERPPNIAQVTNWGCIGGFFFGLIYWRLFLVTMTHHKQVNQLFSSITAYQKV